MRTHSISRWPPFDCENMIFLETAVYINVYDCFVVVGSNYITQKVKKTNILIYQNERTTTLET